MNMLRLANLVLEDGTRLQGSAVGAEAEVVFVLAFNTRITGFQEILADPEIADDTYLEPLTPEALEAILAQERPDATLPTAGGQTGLNLALALSENGVQEKYHERALADHIIHRRGGRICHPRHAPE